MSIVFICTVTNQQRKWICSRCRYRRLNLIHRKYVPRSHDPRSSDSGTGRVYRMESLGKGMMIHVPGGTEWASSCHSERHTI